MIVERKDFLPPKIIHCSSLSNSTALLSEKHGKFDLILLDSEVNLIKLKVGQFVSEFFLIPSHDSDLPMLLSETGNLHKISSEGFLQHPHFTFSLRSFEKIDSVFYSFSSGLILLLEESMRQIIVGINENGHIRIVKDKLSFGKNEIGSIKTTQNSFIVEVKDSLDLLFMDVYCNQFMKYKIEKGEIFAADYDERFFVIFSNTKKELHVHSFSDPQIKSTLELPPNAEISEVICTSVSETMNRKLVILVSFDFSKVYVYEVLSPTSVNLLSIFSFPTFVWDSLFFDQKRNVFVLLSGKNTKIFKLHIPKYSQKQIVRNHLASIAVSDLPKLTFDLPSYYLNSNGCFRFNIVTGEEEKLFSLPPQEFLCLDFWPKTSAQKPKYFLFSSLRDKEVQTNFLELANPPKLFELKGAQKSQFLSVESDRISFINLDKSKMQIAQLKKEKGSFSLDSVSDLEFDFKPKYFLAHQGNLILCEEKPEGLVLYSGIFDVRSEEPLQRNLISQ